MSIDPEKTIDVVNKEKKTPLTILREVFASLTSLPMDEIDGSVSIDGRSLVVSQKDNSDHNLIYKIGPEPEDQSSTNSG